MKLFFVFNLFICSSLTYCMQEDKNPLVPASETSSSSLSSSGSRNGSPAKMASRIKIINRQTRVSSTPIPILVQTEIRRTTSLPIDQFGLGIGSAEETTKVTKKPSLPLIHLPVEVVRYSTRPEDQTFNISDDKFFT